MAKTHWVIIFVTFLVSCISLALLIVSISTSYWIVSSARHPSATRDSEIHYGLFAGYLKKYVLSSGSDYELAVICDYSKAACMYSCQQNADTRQDELRRILNKDPVLPCPTVRSQRQSSRHSFLNQLVALARANDTRNYTTVITPRLYNATLVSQQYIISGYWASAVTFFIFSIIFTTVAAVMSIVNVIYNPVEQIFSICGLYVWNGVAMGNMIMVLILWGALFDNSLQYNIAITDTLVTSETVYSSEGLSSLGYSFWLIFVPIIFSLANILLLLLRKYLIEKQTPPPTITVERSDYTIMLY